MLGENIGLEKFIAKSALEAKFVKSFIGSAQLLRHINILGTLGAFGRLRRKFGIFTREQPTQLGIVNKCGHVSLRRAEYGQRSELVRRVS